MQNHQFGSSPRSAFTILANAVLLAALLTFAAVAQTPRTAEEYVAAGNALVQVGHLDNAIAFYTRAIELKPDLADAYNNRGFVYQKQNKSKLAIDDFTTAIQLQPANALYYKNRGIARSTVDVKLAIADFNTAVKLDPLDAIIWLRLGILEYGIADNKADREKAINHFTEAITLRPDLVDAYLKRSRAYNANFLFDQAFADVNKAIAVAPNYADGYATRGELYVTHSKYNDALADATKAIELSPRSSIYYANRGYIYIRQQGAESIRKIAENAPKVNRSAIELAIADFTKALELQPNAMNHYVLRAIAYCALGEKALSEADRAKAIENGAGKVPQCP